MSPSASPRSNPYDENALEVAARLKDQFGGRIVVINVSEKAIQPVLKKALSVGADELILAEDPAFEGLTSLSVARVLSSVVHKIGQYELILTGRQAADWDSGADRPAPRRDAQDTGDQPRQIGRASGG